MLRVCCLGSWQASVESATGDPNVKPITLVARKEIALFAYLAVEHNTAHSRDELIGLLFPDNPELAAQNNLRVILSRLRNKLGPYAQYLLASRLGVQFKVDPVACWLDTQAFADYATEATHTTGKQRLMMLEAAASLYRGEFMQGLTLKECEAFDHWLLMQRERHQVAVGAILSQLAQEYETERRYVDVVATVTRQLSINPFDESAHRTLIQALAAQGKRAQAMVQHNAFTQTLQSGLGIAPSPETQALVERLQQVETATVAYSPRNPIRQTPPIHLPTQLTPFIGRRRELADITTALTADIADRRSRLVTVVGDGGVGKTRTALQAAEGCNDKFRDGVFFVPLAALNNIDSVITAILQALKIPHIAETQAPRDTLIYALRHRHMLIILDNAEHLLNTDAIAPLVAFLLDMLHSAPQLSLLVTSRERLGMQSEDIFTLRGLPAPSVSSYDDDNDAVQLLVTRARRVDKAFELNVSTLPHVQRICILTGGIPLALELAAATLYHLSIEQIANELAANLDVLSTSLLDLPPSHRSIRACINSTWDRLTDEERNVAACLSVFAESFTHEAALTISGSSELTLERLHARSLLAPEMTDELRYALHPLLQSFLREKLQSQGQLEVTRAKHAEYFHRWLNRQEQILDGNEPRVAIDAMLADLGNIRLAWENTIETRNTAPYVAESCATYAFFVREINLTREGIDTLQRAVSAIGAVTTEICPTQITLLQHLAYLESQSRASKDAVAHIEEAERLAQSAQDPLLLAKVLMVAAGIYCNPTQNKQGEEIAYRALALLDQVPPNIQVVKTRIDLLQSLGEVAYNQRLLDQCKERYENVLALCVQHNLGRQKLSTLLGLTATHFSSGQMHEAIAVSEEIVNFAKVNRLDKMLNDALLNQAAAFDMLGNYARAQEIWHEGLHWVSEAGNARREAEITGNLGISYDYVGQYQKAICYTQRSIDTWRFLGDESSCTIAQVNLSLHLHHIEDHEGARQIALEAIRLCKHYKQDFIAAYGQTMLGHAELALDHVTEAKAAYSEAVAIARARKFAHIEIEPTAGLARVALKQGELAKARALLTPVLAWLDEHGADNLEEPFRVFLTCIDVLRQSNDPVAASLLARANTLLHARADKIPDVATRHSYLNNVQAHVQLQRTALDTQTSPSDLRA